MKKTIALISLLLPFAAMAQQIDTLKTAPEKYVPQQGFFQKAHRDASDPQFMITDENRNFSIGVGGMVHLNTYYDFCGALNSYLFSPSGISVPTDKTGSFGFTATGSDVYVKARSSKGKHNLVAYLELSGAELLGYDYVFLNQAYASVDGLSIGKTYSFFMDLEAGPLTVDLQGPNTQIASIHNLVGYTKMFGKHWTAAAALEQPHSISASFQQFGITTNYTKIPDLAGRVIYRGDKGHIQGGFLFREISYWASNGGFTTVEEGVSKYATGFGLSLSGNWTPTSRLTFSGQYTFGKGVSDYIQDIAGLGVNLGMEPDADKDGYAILTPLASTGGFLSASYSWTPALSSSVVYGFCYLNDGGKYLADTFKSSDYAAANLFYFVSERCFLGIEYLYGRKNVRAEAGAADHGFANRLNACVCYKF